MYVHAAYDPKRAISMPQGCRKRGGQGGQLNLSQQRGAEYTLPHYYNLPPSPQIFRPSEIPESSEQSTVVFHADGILPTFMRVDNEMATANQTMFESWARNTKSSAKIGKNKIQIIVRPYAAAFLWPLLSLNLPKSIVFLIKSKFQMMQIRWNCFLNLSWPSKNI